MLEFANPVKVSIGQFAGIEINDFAVTVARTALWIAESQMIKETESIVNQTIDFFPLKTDAKIVEGNALRMDWNDVAPKEKLNYIMGNPPFLGYSLQSGEQKEDMLSVYVDEHGKPYKKAGKIDYVTGWYYKAAQFIQGTNIRSAFVSTNSITQGEQVAGAWEPLYKQFGIHIDFAYRTFKWGNEASEQAAVHVVIIGFSVAPNFKERIIFNQDGNQIYAQTITPYLTDGAIVFIDSRNKPLCNSPEMVYGNKPTDGGHFFLTAEEREEALAREPQIAPLIKRMLGATEFLNNKERYCLWLKNANPSDIRKSKFVQDRVEAVRDFRLASTKKQTRDSAETPTLFQEIRQPETKYIIVPRHSSENRRYVPFGFVDADIIVNDAVQILPEAGLYHFGIMESNVHMAWMRAVAGRLEMRYRYSKDIVYNNFPWPEPTETQKAKIEATAQGILDARALYPESSLADLYDELTMPTELRKAHKANDRAVMEAYGMWGKVHSEAECVAWLFRMYQKLTDEKQG